MYIYVFTHTLTVFACGRGERLTCVDPQKHPEQSPAADALAHCVGSATGASSLGAHRGECPGIGLFS